MSEKIVMGLLLFAGFYWLRARARGMNLEHRPGLVVVGVFGVLVALLFGEKALFERFYFGPWLQLPLKALLAAATFAAVGFLFLRPAPAGGRGDGDGSAGSDA